MSTTKTLGQTSYEAYHSGFSYGYKPPKWEEEQPQTKEGWERAAQAVLASHTPKLTAADVFDALNEVFEGLAKHSSKPLSAFDEILQGDCRKVAVRLNALLFHPLPASVEESRPVEVEWEEFFGKIGNQKGYRWMPNVQVQHSDKTWSYIDARAQAGKTGEFIDEFYYRRPKINPQPEGGWIEFEPYKTETRGGDEYWAEMAKKWIPCNFPFGQTISVKIRRRKTTPEAGTPSAESGETPTIQSVDIVVYEIVQAERDKARQELASSIARGISNRKLLTEEINKLRTELAEAKKDRDAALFDKEQAINRQAEQMHRANVAEEKLTTAQSQTEKDKATIKRQSDGWSLTEGELEETRSICAEHEATIAPSNIRQIAADIQEAYKHLGARRPNVSELVEIIERHMMIVAGASQWTPCTPSTMPTAADADRDLTIHLLACLAEECGEVAKECHKAQRFGLDDKVTRDPKGPRGTEGPTNREKIVGELNDIFGVIRVLICEGILPTNWYDPNAGIAKGEKVMSYVQYARDIGHLPPFPQPKPSPDVDAFETWATSCGYDITHGAVFGYKDNKTQVAYSAFLAGQQNPTTKGAPTS